MTDVTDQAYLTTLQSQGPVPGTAQEALSNPTWAWLFEVWAQEPRVDYVTQFMAQLARMSVDPGVSYMQLRMEAYTGQREELYSTQTNLAFQDLDNAEPASTYLRDDAAGYADKVWGDFRVFAHHALGGDASDAPVDWATVYADVDAVNQPALKGLQPGDSANYWQSGPLVLIGDGHREAHYLLVGGKDSPTGTVSMDKKGGFLDTGKISAYNSPDPDAFDQAIARFSKKRVVHGEDYELEDDEDGDVIVRPEDGQFSTEDEAWAWYQQCAQAISNELAQRHGLDVALTAQGFSTYRNGSGASVELAWPELRDPVEAADLTMPQIRSTIDELFQQNGW